LGCAEFLRRRMKSQHHSSPMWNPASRFIEGEGA
jgi:hypothetical protein